MDMNLPEYRSFLWKFYSKLFFQGQHASNIFKKQVQNTHFNKLFKKLQTDPELSSRFNLIESNF